MDRTIKKIINLYRCGDYSILKSNSKSGIFSLFVNDDESPDREAKKQISAHLLVIGKAYDDKRLLRMAVEVLMLDDKSEAIDVLFRTKEILHEDKFS